LIPEFQGEYRFLSNFFPCDEGVLYDGKLYPTSEHAYQAAKTLDKVEREQVRSCSTPAQAKDLGKSLSLNQDNWKAIRVREMLKIVRDKFTRNIDLRHRLIQTEDHELIEGNNWNDKFWGMCKGEGQNMLGKILMVVRAEVCDIAHLEGLLVHIDSARLISTEDGKDHVRKAKNDVLNWFHNRRIDLVRARREQYLFFTE